MKNKSIVVSLLGVVGLMVVTVGVSFAFFNYMKKGTTENTLTTGTITFLYTEIDKVGSGISIEDALPITDTEGISQVGTGKVFNFKVESNTPQKAEIPYIVTARMKDTSTLPKDAVKLYLTEVSGSELSTKITGNDGILYSDLVQYDKVVDHDERIIYKGEVLANQNYLKEFNLRMWIDNNVDYSSGDYNGKTFTITVNVYADAKVITKEVDSYMQSVTINYRQKLWSHKTTINKIVFQNKIKEIDGAIENYDISADNSGSVMTRLVVDPDDNTKHIAYIQGDTVIYAPSDSTYLFYNFTALKTIEGMEYLDTSNVTTMDAMFAYCSSLIDLDVGNFDTSNVTRMVQMFWNCKSLTSLDVSNFDTSNVTGMSMMFQNCSSLTSLDLRNFDTSNVTIMGSMFYGCSSLTKLDISNFNTSKVTYMETMFFNCRSLTSLDVSSFDTSKVTNMLQMFGNLSLTSLDLSSFDTSELLDMNYMFNGSSKLTNLDLRKADFSKVIKKLDVFTSVPSNITIIVSGTAYNFIRGLNSTATIQVAG